MDSISDNQKRFSVGVRATADLLEFGGSKWDDYTVGLNNRLIVTYPETTLEIGPSVSYRWFGHQPYEQSWGADVRLSNRSVTNWMFSVAGTVRDVDNKVLDDRDGILIGAEVGGLRSLGGTSIVGMTLAVLTFDASAPYESYYEIRCSSPGGIPCADQRARTGACHRKRTARDRHRESATVPSRESRPHHDDACGPRGT